VLRFSSSRPRVTAAHSAQEIELAKRIERGDLEAKDRMITRTCGL